MGVFRASFAKTLAIYPSTITQMLLTPPPSRGRLGGGISRQLCENVGNLSFNDNAKMLLAPLPSRGRLGGGISRQLR